MSSWRGWNWDDGNFGGSGLEPLLRAAGSVQRSAGPALGSMRGSKRISAGLGDSQTSSPIPARRPVVTKARNALQAIKCSSAMLSVGPCRENAPAAVQHAPAAGFRLYLSVFPSFLQTFLAAADLSTAHFGAVSTETRLRRRPACGRRPICPGLSARRGPLAAGRPGLPGRAA